MLIKNVYRQDVIDALAAVNAEFDNNIVFSRFDFAGRTRKGGSKYQVTLSVKSSKGKGARRSHSGRRIAAACWHVYGTFMDALPESATISAPAVVGYSSMGREKIARRDRRPGDEWQDWNIGSLFQPMYYSEACDCGN